MVVLVVIGMALAITVPMGIGWVADYKFSAGSRAFINAAQLVRIKSIGGPITLNVTQVDQGTSDTEVVFTIPKTMMGAPIYINDDCKDWPPVKKGDYITVAGINNPDFLNGLIFLITDVPTTWNVTKLSAGCEWDQVIVTAKSCMENDPTNCVKWPAGLGPQTSTTGLIRVASCVRFVPYAHGDPYRVHFAVAKSGNSMECKYDPQWMDVKVLVPDPTKSAVPVQITDVTGTMPGPIVFDYAGATRNQMTYTVELRKMTRTGSGGTYTYTPVDDAKSPPIVFSIMPAGRIRLGKPPETYADEKYSE